MVHAHYEDGLALTKFIYWIKHNKKKINEIDAEKKLESFRKKVKIIFTQVLIPLLDLVKMER